MRRTLLGLVLLALGLGLASPAVAAVRSVTVDSFFFEDDSRGDGRVVVDEGDRISFSFQGNNQHSATVDGLFDSGVKQGGQTFTTGALTRPGTYTLYCTVHGARQHGSTLIVRTAAAPPPSASAQPSSAKPTPAPTRTLASPRASTSPTGSTRTAVATAPRVSPAANPTATSAPRATAAATTGTSAAPVLPPRSSAATAATASAASTPGTQAQASEVDPPITASSSRNWVLPVVLLVLLLLAAGGYAVSRRSRTT